MTQVLGVTVVRNTDEMESLKQGINLPVPGGYDASMAMLVQLAEGEKYLAKLEGFHVTEVTHQSNGHGDHVVRYGAVRWCGSLWYNDA